MTLTKAVPILNAAPVPLDGRLADMATVVANADGSPRTGVLGGGVSIVTTTATLNLAVAAAEFVTSKGKADGVSIFTNNGVVNVPVTAAPVSNSRIDVLWVKQNDNTTGDADSLPTFGVTAGVAAASPSKPAIPTGALELATLRIYSGTTATNGGSNVLTNTYQMTAMRGGVVPFRTKIDLDLWTTAVVGQEANVLSDVAGVNGHYIRTASGWIISALGLLAAPPVAVLAGAVPPAGQRIIRHAGLVAVTTNASGDVGINYPTPFPNGVISAVLQRHNFGVLGPTFEVLNETQTLSSLTWRIFSSSGPAVGAGGVFGYAYEAVGW